MIQDKMIGMFPVNLFVDTLSDQEIDRSSVYQAAIDNFNNSLAIPERRSKWEDTNTQFLSYNRNVLDTIPSLSSLKQSIQNRIDTYTKEVLGSNDEYSLYITTSWFTYLQEGKSHPRHTHTNSILSGVFYLAANEDDCVEFFHNDPNNGLNMKLTKVKNEFNYESCCIPVQSGALMLFPSTVGHGVPYTTRKGKDMRISLAFNTFIKGTIGDNQFANLLNI